MEAVQPHTAKFKVFTECNFPTEQLLRVMTFRQNISYVSNHGHSDIKWNNYKSGHQTEMTPRGSFRSYI